MLLRLGPDLPGALRVVADPLDPDADIHEPASPRRAADPADPIRFSLSGVQLKASVHVDLDDEDKITLPLAGQGGRWIAKFPSSAFRELPENELTMLRWARTAGLNVPDNRIIEVASIQNLPAEFPRQGRALLVKRFDRSASQNRIHQEDFAQVFEIEPEEKDLLFIPHDVTVTYAGIGAVVSALAGEGDFEEFVRRVAFMILSGNADAHAKNWSLIYPDRVHARLSPLYDVVSTVAYPSLHRTLPLGFVQPEDPARMTRIALEAITYGDVRELAEQAGESADTIESDVRGFVERARSAWREVRGDAPSFVAEAVDRHLDRATPAGEPHLKAVRGGHRPAACRERAGSHRSSCGARRQTPSLAPVAASRPPRWCSRAARARRCRWRGLGRAAGCPGPEVPKRGTRVAVAVGLPRDANLRRSGDRSGATASSSRDGVAAGRA
jgi:serine/threonine-protein kinase HipA